MFKYERNSKVFEKIDSEEKAYWLGFLYADGYIDEVNSLLIVGLQEKDKDHILKFRAFLETNAPFQDKINNQGKPYRFFRLYDQQIVKDLNEKGLYKKKSLTLQPPTCVPDDLLIHWVRGLFDGDGSIYPAKISKNSIRYRINLTGTKEILLFSQKILGIEKKLDNYSSVPKFIVAGKQEVVDVLQRMYLDSTVFLDRKKELCQLAIQTNLS